MRGPRTGSLNTCSTLQPAEWGWWLFTERTGRPMTVADKYPCIKCRKDVMATKAGKYRTHTNDGVGVCENSTRAIPEHVLLEGPSDLPQDVPREGIDYGVCNGCGRKVQLDDGGHLKAHDTTLRGGDRCGMSETSYSSTVDGVPNARARAGGSDTVTDAATTPSLESTTTSEAPADSASEPSNEGPFSLGARLSDLFLQPGSPFLQPPPYERAPKAEMTDKGKEIAARLREIFYAYSNRNTSDNRSAQKTLGPSEIGTECDRRLAMSLMGIEPVNPGGDGWAAFVGSCGHEGLEQMFKWASANTGRFETEMKLQFGSTLVPKGTGDLLDRTLMMFLDHKFMGEYSLKKLRAEGPSETYRIQVHTYAYGAILAGEKVKDVAIIGWPRAGSSLDGLYVWTEKYDKKIAVDALKRVERIHADVQQRKQGIDHGHYSKLEVAQTFPTGAKYECKFCPFHLPGDKEMARGCSGGT